MIFLLLQLPGFYERKKTDRFHAGTKYVTNEECVSLLKNLNGSNDLISKICPITKIVFSSIITSFDKKKHFTKVKKSNNSLESLCNSMNVISAGTGQFPSG